MRCPECRTTLRFVHERATAQQLQISRTYICISCGATVQTEETITKVREAPRSPAGVVPRQVPKRHQVPADDPHSDFAPLPERPYKGEDL